MSKSALQARPLTDGPPGYPIGRWWGKRSMLAAERTCTVGHHPKRGAKAAGKNANPSLVASVGLLQPGLAAMAGAFRPGVRRHAGQKRHIVNATVTELMGLRPGSPSTQVLKQKAEDQVWMGAIDRKLAGRMGNSLELLERRSVTRAKTDSTARKHRMVSRDRRKGSRPSTSCDGSHTDTATLPSRADSRAASHTTTAATQMVSMSDVLGGAMASLPGINAATAHEASGAQAPQFQLLPASVLPGIAGAADAAATPAPASEASSTGCEEGDDGGNGSGDEEGVDIAALDARGTAASETTHKEEGDEEEEEDPLLMSTPMTLYSPPTTAQSAAASSRQQYARFPTPGDNPRHAVAADVAQLAAAQELLEEEMEPLLEQLVMRRAPEAANIAFLWSRQLAVFSSLRRHAAALNEFANGTETQLTNELKDMRFNYLVSLGTLEGCIRDGAVGVETELRQRKRVEAMHKVEVSALCTGRDVMEEQTARTMEEMHERVQQLERMQGEQKRLHKTQAQDMQARMGEAAAELHEKQLEIEAQGRHLDALKKKLSTMQPRRPLAHGSTQTSWMDGDQASTSSPRKHRNSTANPDGKPTRKPKRSVLRPRGLSKEAPGVARKRSINNEKSPREHQPAALANARLSISLAPHSLRMGETSKSSASGMDESIMSDTSFAL